MTGNPLAIDIYRPASLGVCAKKRPQNMHGTPSFAFQHQNLLLEIGKALEKPRYQLF
jgi:hypothetical protein